MLNEKSESLYILYRDAPNDGLKSWFRKQLLAVQRRITQRRAIAISERFESWIPEGHMEALEANISSSLQSLAITPSEVMHSTGLKTVVDIALLMHKWTTVILSNPNDKTILHKEIAGDVSSLLPVAHNLEGRLAPGTEEILRSCLHDPIDLDTSTASAVPGVWPILLLPNCGEKEERVDFSVPALNNLMRRGPPGMTLMSTASSYEPAGSILSIDATMSEVHWAMFSWTLATYIDHCKLIQGNDQTLNFMEKWLYSLTSRPLVYDDISVLLQTMMGAVAVIAANSKPYSPIISQQYELDERVALTALRHRVAEVGAFQSATAALRGREVNERCLLASAVIAAVGHDYSEMRSDYANGEHANICVLLMRYNNWTFGQLKAWYFYHFSQLYLGSPTSRRIAIISAGFWAGNMITTRYKSYRLFGRTGVRRPKSSYVLTVPERHLTTTLSGGLELLSNMHGSWLGTYRPEIACCPNITPESALCMIYDENVDGIRTVRNETIWDDNFIQEGGAMCREWRCDCLNEAMASILHAYELSEEVEAVRMLEEDSRNPLA